MLKEIWFAMDQSCGKRLKAMLPEWLPFWCRLPHSLPSARRQRLLTASSATLDRVLRPFKIAGPSPHASSSLTALKSSIALVDARRCITTPGFLYVDTVAHCGESTRGNFVWTLTLTDDLTQWTMNRAVWNKGQYETCRALDSLLRQYPFALRGINSDNGSEFINHHLQRYLKEKHKRCQVTRSRPMHKNDNARAEEKNRHIVRELIGYERYEDVVFVRLLNAIYRWNNLLVNHFNACSRVVEKRRVGTSVKKRIEEARTPYARTIELMKEGRKKAKLRELHESLNPFLLKEKIEEGLRKLMETQRKMKEKEMKVWPLPEKGGMVR